MTTVFIALLLWSSLVIVAAIDIYPPTVTDSNNNYADQDSNIIFAPVPEGDAYVVDPGAYTYDGLLPLFRGVQGFVNACFYGDDPVDLFIGLLSGEASIDGTFISALGKWGGGYAVCVVLGLGFMFIFPIVGCCFCCCRVCCQNCGGKMEQKRNGNTSAWRSCYFITLFISCTFLGCGMICTYVVNERMTTLFTEVATTVEENVDDFSRYTNNTINQINYVAHDGFNFTAKVMLRDLDNIGPLVGGSVQTALDEEAGIDSAFDELLKMDPLLLDMITGLEAVDTTKTNVVASITTLESSMVTVANNIDTTFDNCGSPCSANRPDTTDLNDGSNFDPSTMPSFDQELADLEAVYAENITALVLEGKAEFENISTIVEEESAPVIETIRTTVDSFDEVISNALTSVNDMLNLFDAVSNMTSSISGLEETPIAGSLTLGSIERYRWMGGVGLTCFVLLILVLQLTGLIMGCVACCCCGEKDILPTERGALGNCAGVLLMASVGLVFIFGSLIMLLVWITFLVGAPLEQIGCVNIRDTEYTFFKQMIDGGDPTSGPYSTIMGSQEGYTLGNMVFQDPSVPLTVSGLLTDCDNNAPAWQALYIGNFFDIQSVLNYSGTIDIDGEIDKIAVDLSALEILDDNTKTQLTDMSDAISTIDFDGLVAALDKTTVTADFSTIIGQLRATITELEKLLPSTQTTIDELNLQIVELERIENEEVTAVNDAQQEMLTNVITLNASASKVPDQVDTLITTLTTTQNEIQANGEQIIKEESKLFALRVLRIADQFVSFVNITILEELGKCKPISNFYQSVLVNTLCGSIIDSWNGVWFTLGWCVAFMVFGIIFSTKLAKHVRRMKALDDKDPGNSLTKDYDPRMDNKIHPL